MKHLLLVAGPSAGGKSTFMRQLSSKALTDELTRCLPEGVADWTQVNEKTFMKKTPLTHDRYGDVRPLEGLVCHYNILRPYKHSMNGYEDDPGLDLLAVAERVLVVSILPEPRRVLAQWEARAIRLHREESATTLGRLRRIVRGQRAAPLTETQEQLLHQYRSPGWLDGQYQRWLAFVERFAAGGTSLGSIVLDIADEDVAETPFRLAGGWRPNHQPSAGAADA